jgi:hypothetical protein
MKKCSLENSKDRKYILLEHLYNLDALLLSNLVGGNNQKATNNYV